MTNSRQNDYQIKKVLESKRTLRMVVQNDLRASWNSRKSKFASSAASVKLTVEYQRYFEECSKVIYHFNQQEKIFTIDIALNFNSLNDLYYLT